MRWLKSLREVGGTYLWHPLQLFWHGLGHHLSVWRIAWRQQNEQRKVNLPKGDELEFLPAVLEVQETPASPIGRTIVWIIMLLFVLAIIWASFGKIDIVATAQGKVIPSGRTKIIQPLETSAIKAIHVTEGQNVNKGDLLVELDPTASEADVKRLTNDLMNARLEYAGNLAISKKLNNKTASLSLDISDKVISKEQVDVYQPLIDNQYAAFSAKLMALDNAIKRSESELVSLKLSIKQIKKALPLIEKRAQSFKEAVSKDVVSENQYLELEQQRIEQEKELLVSKEKIQEAKAAIEGAREEKITLHAEFSQSIYTAMQKAQQQVVGLENELQKATQRKNQQALYAPVSGEIQQLSIHTIGGIVTPAQELMKIVPESEQLEVEAWVENKDIGFVYPEQIAEIKLEAFPFTKYGTIDGEIVNLSNDSVQIENMGFVYRARVSMNKSIMRVGEKLINISPGMNVTVEIKTGQRRVIEYFLTPILRGFNEAIDER